MKTFRDQRPCPGATRARSALFALLLAAPIGPARAQALREDFWVPNAQVNDVAVGNGAVYLGGQFTQVGPATGSFVALDMVTGATRQPTAGVGGDVLAVASDGSGGWYIGGAFSSVRGQPRQNLARLDAAGNVTAWNPGADGVVRSLARDPASGVVFAGGEFTMISGQARVALSAIDSNGVVTPWNPGFAITSKVYALALYGSTLYTGGSFTAVAAQGRTNAAAFDAATGSLLPWNPQAGGKVCALATFLTSGFPSTLTVYLGGAFVTIGGTTREHLAAVDGTTAALTAWDPGTDGPVLAIALAGGTNPVTNPLRIYIGGTFQNVGFSPRRGIAQLNESSMVASWNPNPWGDVHSLRTAGNLIYVGGSFTRIGGQPIENLAAIDRTTGAATSWDPMVGGPVEALGTSADAVFAGGTFWTVGGVRRNRLAALDLASGQPTAWDPDAADDVNAVEIGPGVIYVGGRFFEIGGQTRLQVAAVDPTTGAVTAWDPFATGEVTDLAVGAGVVYACGWFSVIGSQYRFGLAAVDTVTGLATDWDPAADVPAISLAVHGGKVYVGGSFSHVGGQARDGIAALDPGTGLATPWYPIPTSATTIMKYAFSGPYVVVGGSFFDLGESSNDHLAVLDSTTGLSIGWDCSTDGTVNGLAVEGQVIYAGGSFSHIGGEARSGLAALDATMGTILPWDPVRSGSGSAIAALQGWIYAAGTFLESPHRSFAVFPSAGPLLSVEAEERTTSRVRAAPNPFRSEVTLSFVLPQHDALDVTIHDLNGRLVRQVARGPHQAGEHRFTWDGRNGAGENVAAGVYFVRFESKSMRTTAKVLRLE